MSKFKAIAGFENYLISDKGEVYNLKSGYTKRSANNHSGKGYLYVDLYKDNTRKRAYIHRLVAETFIENPYNKPYVNHKDGNSHNNSVDNLEWCTPLENVEHASKIIKTMRQYEIANRNKQKSVAQIDKYTSNVVETFKSIREASRKTGIPSSNIVCVLKGRQKYTKEYSWCYCEEVLD